MSLRRFVLILLGAILLGWGLAAATGHFDFAAEEYFRPPAETAYDEAILTRARKSLIQWLGLLGIASGGALVLMGTTWGAPRKGD
ncbi:MAG: hypothetical protein EPN72_05960 [Nevskiaceae bacterium]|nr:MAG: hypothetical protein EPN63_03235 [Nevskiaceae bacterium]TBR73677.1 MAG: hypothetical protein EPN72_05960 [Nevskiaceae bacterium]